MIEKRPLSSVVAVNDEGDAAGFSATTVAPLMGWPLPSLIVPPTRPGLCRGGQRAHDQRRHEDDRRSSFLTSRIAASPESL